MRVLGIALSVVMVLAGLFLALAGMGYLGSGGSTSQSWATIGSIVAGFGIALMITVLRKPR